MSTGIEETLQLKILVSKPEKLAWQAKAKLEKTNISEKIRELMNGWLGGMKLTELQQQKAEEEELAELRKMSALMKGAPAWPVGEPRLVGKAEVRDRNIPPEVMWIDEVDNWYDENMALLTRDGELDDRVGGGGLVWELTWQPAVLGGWRPRAEDTSFYTKKHWEHSVKRLIEKGRLPKDFDINFNTREEN